MKKYFIVIVIIISIITISFWPASPILKFINQCLVPVIEIGFTQINGTIWNGNAFLNIPYLKIQTPIKWNNTKFSLLNMYGEWDFYIYDHKQATVKYFYGKSINLLLYPLIFPAKTLMVKMKNKEDVKGELTLSGNFDLVTLIAKGNLSYESITINRNNQNIYLGSGITYWECTAIFSKCQLSSIPKSKGQVKGTLYLQDGLLTGNGYVIPIDFISKKTLNNIPINFFDPIQLIAINYSSNIIWKWNLPSFSLKR